jgi:hypothetical protein
MGEATFESHKRTAAGRALAGGASKAVVTERDGSVFKMVEIDVPNVERPSLIPFHAELLVEIAVIDVAAPADTQCVAAHETGDRCGVEGVDEQLHVGLQLSTVPKPGGETADRHVRNCIEATEVDVEMPLQFPFVVGFQLRLVRWEEGADWIVNEIKTKVVPPAVAEPIEKPERANTGIEDAVATLRVDIGRFVTWHGCNDVHPMVGEKTSEPFVAGVQEDGEIAAINDFFDLMHLPEAFDEIAEVRDHFGRASGEVDGVDVRASQPVENTVNRIAINDFLALWARIHMAMDASEIAELADVKLEDLGALAAKRQAVIGQPLEESLLNRGVKFLCKGHLSMERSRCRIIPSPAFVCPSLR